jgi:hypothetical protein
MSTGETQSQDVIQSENPYVGPRPFREDEQHRFFGRTEEIAILEGLTLARRETLLFAQSGAGKTSLLWAGLIPSLTRERSVGQGRRLRSYQKMRVLRVLRVGGAIPAGIRPENVRNAHVFSALLTLNPDEDPNRLAGLSLGDGLAAALAPPQPGAEEKDDEPPPGTLVIFDQFEELFTRHPGRWREREDFFKQVRDALDTYPSLHVLFSMREDYIAELSPYAGLLPDRLQTQFRLEKLRNRAALDAIRLPAERGSRRFEEGSAEELVTRLRGTALEPSVGKMREADESMAALPANLAEFVEPVQLQVVCQSLWNKMPPGQIIIRKDDVERFGDVHLALTEFYEQAVSEAVQKKRISELRLRTWFARPPLVTPAGTRGLVYRDATDTGGLPNDVVDLLDEKHIIRPMVRGKDTWYELAHDRLVEPIRKSNLKWRSEHATDWQLQAEKWLQQGEPRSQLLSEGALKKAEEWIAEQGYEPEPQEQRFLDYSRQELERQSKAFARQTEKRTNLADSGWGIIFGWDDPRATDIERALGELLRWRSQQAGPRYRVFSGENGYRGAKDKNPGETAQEFQTRFGVGPGMMNPERVPYYLLIVGGPERIPFEFQYALQTQYAVGRISFDTLTEYASYARSVVKSEDGSFSLIPKVALFGPQHPDDVATTKALDELFRPLLSTLEDIQQNRDWEIEVALQEEATRSRLIDLMGGPQTPALLFSASYGASTPNGDPEQEELQGAVMLQVYPTPQPGVKPESTEVCLTARDLGQEARLLGSIAFLFGAWSAGTPRLNSYPANRKQMQEIAPRPFVARLPQRLMGHPMGGMLAVIGHVDMTLTSSFSWRGVAIAMNHFSGTLRRLMAGYTVGAAVEPINQRYVLLSNMLAEELQQVFFYGGERKETELTELNLYAVDARNFIILGDPAARLPLENGPVTLNRPTIEPVQVKEEPEPATRESMTTPGLTTPEGAGEGVVTPPAGKEAVTETHRPTLVREEGNRRSAKAEILYFNGINGATGEYFVPPMAVEELAKLILQEKSPEDLDELRFKYRRSSQNLL